MAQPSNSRIVPASEADLAREDMSTAPRASIPGVGSPITNEAYDVIAALHEKLQGLEAYRKYARDGNARVWQELTAREVENVRLLVQELERLVREGKLALKEPGRANA